MRKAALHLAGIKQATGLPPPEIERRRSAWFRAQLFDEGNDRICAALAAFDLDPAFLPTRTVGRITPLRHNAFKAHLAGLGVDLLRVGFEVVGIEKASGHIRNQCLELLLAFAQ